MRKNILFILIGIITLKSCKDFSDLKLLFKDEKIDIINPKIKLALEGKEKINGLVRIKILDEVVHKRPYTLKSKFDAEYSEFQLDLKKLGDKTIDLANIINNQKIIPIEITWLNEEEKIKIKEEKEFKVIVPPFSIVKKIEGENFKSIYPNTLSKELQKNKNIDLNNDELNKVATISFFISNQSNFIESENTLKTDDIIKFSKRIKVNLELDEVHNQTIIVTFPVSKNKYKDSGSLKDIIDEIATTDRLEELKNDYKGNKENNNYKIEIELKHEDAGENGVYLITIDKRKNYSIQQIGAFKADGILPGFRNSKYCSFNGDWNIEGLVCLQTEHFYGYNPYRIPFVGKVYGDIDKIYVNNKRVKFKIGEELYFKKSVYLDGGYNRIPVKIIDKQGNKKEGFIPVTIENMNDSNIEIDNEVYIEN